MPSTISQMKEALGAGARASKYLIRFAQPNVVNAFGVLANIDYMVKAASFPGKSIGQIEVWNQGRKGFIPGDTAFQGTWNLTFYNTEAHEFRRNFFSWMQACDNYASNLHTGVPTSLMSDMGVAQLDSAGNETAIYTFHSVWPMEVDEITLGDDQADTLQEFNVTFSYDFWVNGTEYTDNPGSANGPTLNTTAYS